VRQWVDEATTGVPGGWRVAASRPDRRHTPVPALLLEDVAQGGARRGDGRTGVRMDVLPLAGEYITLICNNLSQKVINQGLRKQTCFFAC